MRVVRVLIYEGDEEWINRTISKSLPAGKNVMSAAFGAGFIESERRTITVMGMAEFIDTLLKGGDAK